MTGDPGTRCLFEADGDRYRPTVLTTGPWRSDAMHGGAPSALIGTVVAEAAREGELVASVAIDLERPVPLEPLEVTVGRRQVSRRIAHLEVELGAAAGRVARARAVLVSGEPDVAVPVQVPLPHRPGDFAAMDWQHLYPSGEPNFIRDAVEHRVHHGGYGVPEPSGAWLRLRGPVVEGHQAGALAELLAVADFGSPLSQTGVVGPGLALINIDVNLSLFRSPVGPWFYLDAVGHVGPGGVGLAITLVADGQGPLGAVTQSQVAHRYVSSGRS